MDEPQNTPLPPTAHVSAQVGEPTVQTINGHPGRYAIDFGVIGRLSIHATADQWDRIDAAVRAGIASHTAAVAS
jgi:hypothetical protein